MMQAALLSVLLLATGLNGLQGRPVPAETKRLEYFVGSSSTEGFITIGATKGRFTAKDKAVWANGGFFVENRSEYTTPFGPGTLFEILGYDPARKVYTHDSYSSAGQRISSTGTVDGNVWTWTGVDGRSRHIITVTSPTSFQFKTEISQDGKNWSVLSEGITTKTD
jgi:hypothetical protein